MKVLHVIPSIAPAQGGPSHAVVEMVKALRLQDIDAEIITTNDNGADLLDVILGQQIEYQNVPVLFFPRFSPPITAIREFQFSRSFTIWLWQNISRYDLLHIHIIFSYPSTVAMAIARQFKVPYIVRTIGQISPWSLAQSRLKKQIYTALIERHNLNQAAAIHCTAPGEAQDAINFGITSPKIVLPLGVTPPQRLPDARAKLSQVYNIPAQIPIILFLSRIHYKKSPDLLIQVVSRLIAQNKDCHLIIAGSGDPKYVESLKHLVDSLGLETQTSFPGFMVGIDKDLLLQGADLFVLPSFAENFGIALAEAMIAGLPVITTPGVQISAEIEQAQAGLIIDREAEPLQAAIDQLLTSEDLRKQMGKNGQHLAREKYSWQSIATNLISVYTVILAGDSPSKCVMPRNDSI